VMFSLAVVALSVVTLGVRMVHSNILAASLRLYFLLPPLLHCWCGCLFSIYSTFSQLP
jgi:hypothetical protein